MKEQPDTVFFSFFVLLSQSANVDGCGSQFQNASLDIRLAWTGLSAFPSLAPGSTRRVCSSTIECICEIHWLSYLLTPGPLGCLVRSPCLFRCRRVFFSCASDPKSPDLTPSVGPSVPPTKQRRSPANPVRSPNPKMINITLFRFTPQRRSADWTGSVVFLYRCISIFFVEFQMHFGRDYSGTAWIHSLVDCTTMLCGMWTFGSCLLPPNRTGMLNIIS